MAVMTASPVVRATIASSSVARLAWPAPLVRLAWMSSSGRPQAASRAGLDERDPVAEPLGLVGVVGDEQDGDAVVAQFLDEPPALPPGGGVEAGRQLIEDDQARAADEGEGDRHALLLPAGQLPVAGVALVRQAEARDKGLGIRRAWDRRTRTG